MVIVMHEGATEEQIQHVIDRVVSSGFDVHRSTGASHTVLGAVGVHRDFDHRDFELLEGVREVVRITQPFKLASRQFKPQGTVIDLGRGVKIGGDEIVVAAGPCSVESPEQINAVAEAVSKTGARILRAGAFKPRTSPYAFQGLGEKGLQLIREAADKFKLFVVSEVMDLSQIEMMGQYVDIFQVGARNMQNYFLLRALGEIQKPVLLKRGMSATIEELLLSAEYILSGGNYNVILCERGIRTFETRSISPPSRSSKNFLICPSSPILRMARAAATKFLPWRALPSPPALMACSSKFTMIPTTPSPMARSPLRPWSSLN